jgi:septum site-determining protein MinC
VSVAGTYCLKENIPIEYLDKAVQVSYLDGQGLVFELME